MSIRKKVWTYVTAALVSVLGCGLVSCGSREPIRLGFLGSLSGSASELSVSARQGVEVAIREVNRRGGVDNRKLELVTFDDQNDPSTSNQAVEYFLSQNVIGVVGPMTSNVGIEFSHAANSRSLITLSPTVSAEELFGRDDYFFLMDPSNTQDGAHLADFAATHGLTRMAVFGDFDNRTYVETFASAFAARLKSAGGTVIGFVHFRSSGSPDFGQLARQIVALNPSGVLCLTGATATAQLVQNLRTMGVRIPVMTNAWSMTPDLLSEGGVAAEGVIVQSLFDPQSGDARFTSFSRKYVDLFSQQPTFGSVFAYDAAVALVEALTRAGTGATPEKLKSELLSVSIEGADSKVEFNRFGDAARQLYLYVVRNGAFERFR